MTTSGEMATVMHDERPSSRSRVSNARKVEREGVERGNARERRFELRARCRVDVGSHRRQHCTGGRGTAEWQHRAGRQPFLRSRGAGLLPAGARADRHSRVSYERARARETLAIFAVCNGGEPE